MNWDEILGFLEPLNAPIVIAVFKVIVITAIGILVIRVLNTIVKRVLNKSKLEKGAHGLVRTVVRSALYILLFLVLADSVGIDVTGIVAFASVATLAISLALQNMLANVIGGFTLLYTRPFTSGDYVEIGGQGGSVKEVGIAYTRLITPDNKLVSIPNSNVLTAEIVNYSITGTRRVDVTVSASYASDPEEVIAALAEAAQHELLLPDHAPAVTLASYGESAINYTVRVWTASGDYWTVHQAITRKIFVTFREKGIQMTYPHLNVHLEK